MVKIWSAFLFHLSQEEIKYFPVGLGSSGLPSYTAAKTKTSLLIKLTTLMSSTENEVYSFASR